ncbi:MAG: type II secretion system F family protein [Sterolibacterium sp.]|nr:type II secretion system F family protein [Sterolibacterium sp.]
MPYYRYQASDTHGRISKGRMEALHDVDLEGRLKSLGLDLMRARPLKTARPAGRQLPKRAAIDFLFQLEMQLRSGIPLRTALADLHASCNSRDAATSQQLAARLLASIDTGSTLTEAFQTHSDFSAATCALIRAGEISGQLPEVIGEIVRSLKWQDEMLSKTRKLLLYPTFVMLVISAMASFLMIYLVPQLLGFLRNMGGEIPAHTRLLLWLSGILVDDWWLLLSLPVCSAFILTLLVRQNPALRHFLQRMLLATPYLGPILHKSMIARLADTFSLMYRTGIPVIDGLGHCQQIADNLPFQQAMRRVRERIVGGKTIADSFAAEPFFPALFIRMLKTGEATGALDTALGNISHFYRRDIEESISRIQVMLEPAMTVLMGLILGWIMLAVLGPIYDTIATLRF